MPPQPMFDLERRVFDTEFRPWEIDLTRLHPLRDGVILERLEEPATIVLTDKVPVHRGRVLRTGPGKRRQDGSLIPVTVKAGDMVTYCSSTCDNGTHVLIQEADILFIENTEV